jgi:hypothetical protein
MIFFASIVDFQAGNEGEAVVSAALSVSRECGIQESEFGTF